jgi:hypothetical protein
MSTENELLEHDAELILSLYGNAQAQQQRLLQIEQQLRRQGAETEGLHQQIEQLASTPDPQQYRCRYDPQIS